MLLRICRKMGLIFYMNILQYIYIVFVFLTWICDSPSYLAEEGMYYNNGVLSNPHNNMWHIKALNNMLWTVSVFHVLFPVSLQLEGTTPVKMPGPAWNSWSGRSKRMPRWRDDLWPCQFSHTMLRPGMIFDEQSIIEEESLKLFIMGRASLGLDKLRQS